MRIVREMMMSIKYEENLVPMAYDGPDYELGIDGACVILTTGSSVTCKT
jgi:hypothetical protein